MTRIDLSKVKDVCKTTRLETRRNIILLPTEKRVLGSNATGWQRFKAGISSEPTCGVNTVSKGGLAETLLKQIKAGNKPSGVHFKYNQLWIADSEIAAMIDALAELFVHVRKNRNKVTTVDGKAVRYFQSPHHDTAMIANAIMMYARFGLKAHKTFGLSKAKGPNAYKFDAAGKAHLYHSILQWYGHGMSQLFNAMRQSVATSGAGGQNLPGDLGSRDRFRTTTKR
ncbi:MAG: hypothetical protein KDA96_03795 [Planctomycetaceae bacterium]|nr:hypothetical protein [Planctomycetaceae bacterium]